QINSVTIYQDLSSEIVNKLEQNLSVSEIIDWLRSTTRENFSRKYGKNPEVGALNNATGRWNEFIATTLFSEIVLDFNQATESCIVIFPLPNSRVQTEGVNETYSKFLSLFNNNDFDARETLARIAPFQEKIFLPSPDYIIAVLRDWAKPSTLKGDREIRASVQSLLEKQAKEPNNLDIYGFLQGKLHLEDVKAAVSLKTSNRPDRRYQPLFEAAIIKAIGYVLQQRWKYYMVASELTSMDRTIFRTAIAPHGIALEEDFKLVDGTFLYKCKADLVPLIETIL
ncbi:MAG: Cfr10I/Bse634I family restriction endonuclease, partial [Oscillatoria sp. PMC 1076.18]|nr:Cfr10I/Bse634I family restriction endonuclease [Oscillatoria sp. PMC 1076.18]